MVVTPRYKILITEIDGSELDYQEELSLDSDKVYFSDAAYTADNVFDAIKETSTKGGQARFSLLFGYQGNSNNGRWLELFKNVASNSTPYIVAESSQLISLAISNGASSSGATFTIYRNGNSIATLSIGTGTGANNTGYVILPTPIALAMGDELSVQQTSAPSTTDPVFIVNIKVEF